MLKKINSTFTREHELKKLLSLYLDAKESKGRIALITAPEGYGKTTLVNHFQHLAAGQENTVSVTCARLESTVPLGVINRLLTGQQKNPFPPEQVEELLRSADWITQHWNGESSRYAQVPLSFLESFQRLFIKSSARTPVVVVVEEIQHIDVPSLQCVLFLARRILDSRVVIVLTENGEQSSVLPHMHSDLYQQNHFHHLRPPPLSMEELNRFAAELTGRTVAPEHIKELHWSSGGNPTLVRALLDDADQDRRPAKPKTVRVKNACSALLSGMDPKVVRTALGLTLLSSLEWAPLLDRLFEEPPGTTFRALRVLTRTGLISDRSEIFRLPEIRDVLMELMPEEESAELHSRLARLLYLHGASPLLVTHQLLKARNITDPQTVPLLQQGAEIALEEGDTTLATKALELALHACGDEHTSAELRIRLLETAHAAGMRFRRADVLRLAEDAQQGFLSYERSVALMPYLVDYSCPNQARQVLTHLLTSASEAEHPLDPVLGQWLELTQPDLTHTLNPPEVGWSERNAPGERPDPRLTSLGLLRDTLRSGASPRPSSHIDQIVSRLATHEPDTGMIDSSLRALLYTGSPSLVLQRCNTLLKRSGNRVSSQTVLTGLRAQARLWLGDLDGAEADALLALRNPFQSASLSSSELVSVLVRVCDQRGQYTEAENHLKRQLPEGLYLTRYGLPYLLAQAEHHLATGDPRAALDDFLFCGELARSWDMDAPGFVPWRSGAAIAYLRLGERDRAGELLDEESPLAEKGPALVFSRHLRARAEINSSMGRTVQLARAAQIARKHGAQAEFAATLAALARSHEQRGERRKADTIHRHAQYLAERHDPRFKYAGLLPQFPGTDDKAGSEPEMEASGLVSLSLAEQRVSTLAARGLTNQAISKRLFITVSTVEQHMTRVYRKLGISGRAQLPTSLLLNELVIA